MIVPIEHDAQWESIEHGALQMKNSGFDQSSYTNLFNGIVSIHKGFKI